jgi:hypothetical protein
MESEENPAVPAMLTLHLLTAPSQPPHSPLTAPSQPPHSPVTAPSQPPHSPVIASSPLASHLTHCAWRSRDLEEAATLHRCGRVLKRGGRWRSAKRKNSTAAQPL